MIPWVTGWEIGSRVYDAVQHRASALNSNEYITRYVEQMNAAVDSVIGLHALDTAATQTLTHELLKSIALVVQAYHSKTDVIQIRSNYMIAEPPTDASVTVAMFCNKNRRADSLDGTLRLAAWSDNEDQRLPSSILLPLEKPEESKHCLFGAPKAYLSGHPQIVEDTLDFHNWIDCEQEQIREALSKYFHDNKEALRSFVSFPINLPTPPRRTLTVLPKAVVNVQSNRKAAFGFFSGNQRKLVLLMAPFMQILGHCIAMLHSVPAVGGERTH